MLDMSGNPSVTTQWRADGERIAIEPFSKAHLTESYVAWLNDPHVVRYSELRHTTHTLDSCRRYMEAMRENDHLFGAIMLKIPNQSHIGNITAYLDRNNAVANLAILIGERSVWTRGLGCEAWITMMNFILHKCLARKVVGGTMETNKTMLRTFAKSGMREEARFSRHLLVEGGEVDIVHFARFAEEGPVAQRSSG